MIPRSPRFTPPDTLFPSTTLFRSPRRSDPVGFFRWGHMMGLGVERLRSPESERPAGGSRRALGVAGKMRAGDRKSTRLNSIPNAHLVCRLLLEKKKRKHQVSDRARSMTSDV